MRRIVLTIVAAVVLAGGYLTYSLPTLAGVTCSLPYTLTNGTIADATQVMANYTALVNCLANAAAAGANNDITSLSGLTTPLTPNQGGANVFLGPSPVASGNEIVIAGTTPTGYANTTNYTVVFVSPTTNTATESAMVNGQAVANIYKQSTAGATPLTGGEIQSGQVIWMTFDGTEFQINPVPSVSAGWGLSQNASATAIQINTTHPPYGFDTCVNAQITAISTGSSTLLQVNLKAADTGLDPSATHPVLCPFRDSTIANGDPVWLAITSALSINTNATGATLGSINGLPFRIWVDIFDNAGTPVLALFQSTQFTVGGQGSPSNTVQLWPMDESTPQTTVAIGSSATKAGTYYTPNGTTLTTTPFRILGYLDYTNGLTTAGTYASAPVKTQLFGPGIKKPGDRISFIRTSFATVTSTTNLYTPSATPPTTAGGVLIVSQTVTPNFAGDIIRVTGQGNVANGGSNNPQGVFLWNGTTSVALDSSPANGTSVQPSPYPVEYTTIVTATSITFSLYGFGGINSTTFVNGNTLASPFFSETSSLAIEDIQP